MQTGEGYGWSSLRVISEILLNLDQLYCFWRATVESQFNTNLVYRDRNICWLNVSIHWFYDCELKDMQHLKKVYVHLQTKGGDKNCHEVGILLKVVAQFL